MLEFGNITITYTDELRNEATLSGEVMVLNPKKDLTLKHPLLENPEEEILMGVILKRFIRLDSNFAEESGLSLKEVAGAFIFAGKRRANPDFEKDLDYIDKLIFEAKIAEDNPEIVAWVEEKLLNLESLGFIRSGDFYFEEESTASAPLDEESEEWFIPTDLLLSFWSALQIEEF